MPKIAFIGAGSQKFVRGTIVDLLNYEELNDCSIWLMDINKERLDRCEQVIRKMIDVRKAPMTVASTTDRREALEGADFVVVTIMVGGMKHYRSDTYIPAKHGVPVAVGDTVGPGAVFRLVRTAPAVKEIVDDVREVAPDAWIVTYVNPMAMTTKAFIRYGHANTVGLCHAVQGAVVEIGKWLGIPHDEIEYTAGGLNHLNFYLTLEHRGQDLYPELLARADDIIANADTWEAETWSREKRGYERVRMEIMKYLGYFPVEGPWHQGEYYPYFRKNRELVERYGPDTGWAYNFDLKLAEKAQAEVQALIDGEQEFDFLQSSEYGVPIIHSITTGEERLVYGNVINGGCIENLPSSALTEIPCKVDANGIALQTVGTIPLQLAGIMHQHVTLHELALEGVIQKSRTKVRQAIQADPLTAAVLTLPQIEAMVDDLFAENGDFMSGWE